MEWTLVLVAVITATSAVVIAVINALVTTRKLDKVEQKTNEVAENIVVVTHEFNHKMDRFIEEVRAASLARGVLQEKERREAVDEADSAQGEL